VLKSLLGFGAMNPNPPAAETWLASRPPAAPDIGGHMMLVRIATLGYISHDPSPSMQPHTQETSK